MSKRIPQQELFRRALEQRGYQLDRLARSSRFVVMQCPAGEPLIAGPHRVLLGKAGALRLTRGTLDNSIDIRETWAQQLITEAHALSQSLREALIEGEESGPPVRFYNTALLKRMRAKYQG